MKASTCSWSNGAVGHFLLPMLLQGLFGVLIDDNFCKLK